ncbi:MAG: hypothetical protein ABI036_03335 [Fibrobacteria bacterium]
MKLSYLKPLGFLAILPFLLGFAPPEENGTYVGASAGRGQFISASGCSRPRLHEFSDFQAGAYHKRDIDAEGSMQAGLGADAGRYSETSIECAAGCGSSEAHRDQEETALILSPYLTFDWKWIGLTGGLHYLDIESIRDSALLQDPQDRRYSTTRTDFLPRGRIRLGYAQKVYASVEVLNGRPFGSGGGLYEAGVGGRVKKTDLYAGLRLGSPVMGSSPGSGAGSVAAAVARTLGPVRIRLDGGFNYYDHDYERTNSQGEVTEQFGVEEPQYRFSAGVDWRLPF